MAHMDDGIKKVEYEVIVYGLIKPVYRFVAEFIFEESKNKRVMEVKFILVSESGKTVSVIWEKTGPVSTPNLPRL